MNAILTPKRMTVDEYLAWEEGQPERHEYIGGEVYAMTGVRQQHNLIAGNAYVFWRQALRGKPCRVFTSDLKLRVDESDAFFYPDLMVSCDSRDRLPEAELAIRHPWLICEVLSDSTAAYNRGAKFAVYRRIDSFTHYLLIEQARAQAELHRKNLITGTWEVEALRPGDTMHFDTPHPIDWPVASLYDDVVLPEALPGQPK